MTRVTRSAVLLLVVVLGATVTGQQVRSNVLVGGKLTSGFDMGVASSEGRANWVTNDGAHFRLSYPSDQTWGAVFITVGKPRQPPRPFRDLSAFDVLALELKGGQGGETVDIGIKSNTQPDDGSETKIPVKLTADWQVYDLPLARFTGVELDKLYIVAELVFSGSEASTVFVRNVSYTKAKK
jgi:hypothetical protein